MPRKGKRSAASKARWIRLRLAAAGIDPSSVVTQPPPREHKEPKPKKPRSRQHVKSVQATHCQSDKRYGKYSRNHQCSCMALTFLAYHSEGWQFDAMLLNKVLEEGDSLYVSVKDQLMSDGSYVHDHLALEEMPKHILTDRDVYYVHMSSVGCGPLRAEDAGQGDLFPLTRHLQRLLSDVSLALLIVSPECIALFRDSLGRYGVFDSHSRSAMGLPQPRGTAVMLTFTHLSDLIDHLNQLFRGCDDNASYEFVPVSFESLTGSSAALRAETTSQTCSLTTESAATQLTVETHNSNTDVADQTAAALKKLSKLRESQRRTLLRRVKDGVRMQQTAGGKEPLLKQKQTDKKRFRTDKLQALKTKYAQARHVCRRKMLLMKNYYAGPHAGGLNGVHHVCRPCYSKMWPQ